MNLAIKHQAACLSLPDLHGLLIIRLEELKVPVGLDGLPAVLAYVEHYGRQAASGWKQRCFFFFFTNKQYFQLILENRLFVGTPIQFR